MLREARVSKLDRSTVTSPRICAAVLDETLRSIELPERRPGPAPQDVRLVVLVATAVGSRVA